MTRASCAGEDGGRRAAWREPGLWALVVFVLATYFSRMDAVSMRHEEPHRGQVGAEMLATGDWVVPRQQGGPFLSRPPLHNWVIAGLASLRGGMDTASIRLPSALAVLATVVLVYWYARRFLGPLGAFAAGAAYASMGHVLELGRKGETEAFFSLLVAASLLLWHAAAARGPISVGAWSIACAFAALGTLTKGPQAPVYFWGAASVYLVSRRRWRELLRPTHLCGIAVYAAIVLAWLVPFWREMGMQSVRVILVGDVGKRFVGQDYGDALAHLVTFPMELFASTLPWSVLLLAYARADFRRELGPFREAASFAAIALAVSFPTVWIPPGARPRYFMPLYPLLAVLAGAVAERAVLASAGSWRGICVWFLRGCGAASALAGLALLVGKFVAPPGSPLDQPLPFVFLTTFVCLGVGALLLRPGGPAGDFRAAVSIAGVLCVAGLGTAGVVVNAYARIQVDTGSQVAELRALLPAGVELKSLGKVDPLFIHHFGEPVATLPWGGERRDQPPDTEFFCVDPYFSQNRLEELRFPWEPVHVVVCDFLRRDRPIRAVHVGRVLRGKE